MRTKGFFSDLLIMLALVILGLAAGCAGTGEYVAADKEIYQNVEPWVIPLIKDAKKADGSPFFTDEERDRHLRTIGAWKLMIDKSSK